MDCIVLYVDVRLRCLLTWNPDANLALFAHTPAVYMHYSGTPLNGHPWKVDTHDITDNSETPDCPSIHFNT